VGPRLPLPLSTLLLRIKLLRSKQDNERSCSRVCTHAQLTHHNKQTNLVLAACDMLVVHIAWTQIVVNYRRHGTVCMIMTRGPLGFTNLDRALSALCGTDTGARGLPPSGIICQAQSRFSCGIKFMRHKSGEAQHLHPCSALIPRN